MKDQNIHKKKYDNALLFRGHLNGYPLRALDRVFFWVFAQQGVVGDG
jgi:hypothetical protein